MFDWGLFTDYHEAIPHLVFEGLTVAVPAVAGWVLGHRKHDAKRHPATPLADKAGGMFRRELSHQRQRIEALEARAGYEPWDAGRQA